MTKSQRLKPIVRLSVSKERDEAAALGRVQQALRDQEQRLDELLRYLDEYRRLLERDGAGGVDAHRLQSYRSFIARLNQTIGYQRQRVEQARREVERQRAAWLAARTRCRSLDKAVERHRHAERRVRARGEQREDDDRAARACAGDRDDPGKSD
jgi:flagellar export protein FliJ